MEVKKHFENRWRLITCLIVVIVFLYFAWHMILKTGDATPLFSLSYRFLLISSCTLIAFIFGSHIFKDEQIQENKSLYKKYIVEPIVNSICLSFKSEISRLEVKIDQLMLELNKPTVLEDVDWNQLVHDANVIEFLVQGWDGWMEENRRALEGFFKEKGIFNLYVLDPKSSQAKYARKLMARRLDRKMDVVAVEIQNTIDNLIEIQKASAGSNDIQVNVKLLNEVNWYFASIFKSTNNDKRDVLILSPYSHHKYPIKETPAIIIYRDIAPRVFTWIESEFETLTSLSTNYQVK